MQVMAVAGLLFAAIGFSSPRITNITPASGSHHGGSRVRISGSGFEALVRVVFRTSDGEAEGFVVSVSPTNIELITPPVVLGPGMQAHPADVVVATRAGTPDESRATLPGGYRYENVVLAIASVSPRSGPVRGDTYVTIFGDGFQAPVRVFFGATEARVVRIQSDSIVVFVPAAEREERVDVRVENINARTSAVIPGGYTYADPAAILAVVPDRGPSSGGTPIRIQGGPFRQPSHVAVGNVPLQIIEATESEIVAMTPPLSSICESLTGAVRVFESSSGVESSGPNFMYEPTAEAPAVVASGSMVTTSGGEVEVELAREGNVQFSAGGRQLEVIEQNGTRYRLRAPVVTGFPRRACITEGISGTRPGVSGLALRIIDPETGCRTENADTIWIRPPQPVVCTLPPHAIVSSACVRFPRGTTTRTITIANRALAGTSDLEIAVAAVRGPFSIASHNATIAAGRSASFTVTFEEGETRTGEVVFTTNDREQPALRVCLTAPSRIRD